MIILPARRVSTNLVHALTSVHSLILTYFHAYGRVQLSAHCHVSLYLFRLSVLDMLLYFMFY